MLTNYKEEYENLIKFFQSIQSPKKIELNKKYWVVEWSWNPMCDGRYVYEKVFKEHIVIDNIDCYFTNTNNRIYLKEDIYEEKEEAQKVAKLQNSFGYDYETKISRVNYISNIITVDNFHWQYIEKKTYNDWCNIFKKKQDIITQSNKGDILFLKEHKENDLISKIEATNYFLKNLPLVKVYH